MQYLLAKHMLATGSIILEIDNILTANFVEVTLKHYFDHAIALEKMKEETKAALKEDSIPCD